MEALCRRPSPLCPPRLPIGTFCVASGITQFAAGFVVDRSGARAVLVTGIALLAVGCLLAAIVPGVAWLHPVAVLKGEGNGVFHPANFAILNANVAVRRLGYAYELPPRESSLLRE